MKLAARIRWIPPEVANLLAKSPEIVVDEMKRLFLVLQGIGVTVLQARAPRESGRLASSFPLGAPGSGSTLTATRMTVGSKLWYAGAQDSGTAKGKRWWPPETPIREWVSRHLGQFNLGEESSEYDVNRVAFLVSRKIAQKGIRPKHYVADAFTVMMQQAGQVVEDAAKRILERLGLKWG